MEHVADCLKLAGYEGCEDLSKSIQAAYWASFEDEFKSSQAIKLDKSTLDQLVLDITNTSTGVVSRVLRPLTRKRVARLLQRQLAEYV